MATNEDLGMNIRLFKPCLGEEELENIRKVFDRAWLGLGPMVAQFEREWSEYFGVRDSVGVNSGTAALHVALAAYNFPPGKKVLVPAITFGATAAVILYCRMVPVFVDIDPVTLTISLEDLDRKYTSDCVAIIPVHFGGQPCAMDRLVPWAKERNLVVIEDCANCAGGVYKGKKLGTWGDVGCFSFEDKKNMATGDGGMISTDREDLISLFRPLRWHGIDKDTWRRQVKSSGKTHVDAWHWYYEITVLGYKYNMIDLVAAVGLAQLRKLDWMNKRRSEIIKRYMAGIENCKNIRPSFPYELEESAYWLFSIRCAKRDALISHLSNRGISTGVHFMPIPLHPLYRSYNYGIETALAIWQELVTLPLFTELREDEVDYVIEALCEFDAKGPR